MHTLYLFFHHNIYCPLHKKYETSAVCSRSSQLNVAKGLTEVHVPDRLDNAGQITVARYALFSVAAPHTLESCRCGRTQAKGQPKRAVKWRNVKVNLATCGCSGSGVTVPYRNGLLEPMHRTGSGYAPMQRSAQSIKPTKQVAVLRHVHAASQKCGQTSASPTARPTMRHQLMLGQVREWQCRPNGKARPATY